jgi:hypothetical protein
MTDESKFKHFHMNPDQEPIPDFWEREKQEQGEPVAWRHKRSDRIIGYKPYGSIDEWDSLYTTPQQRTWVGLTFEEICECEDEYLHTFARAIEAKLKEKNT